MNVATLVAVVLCLAPTPRDEQAVSALVAEHSLAFTAVDGSFAGPGWDALLERAGVASYVALGEQHGLAEVPRFTGEVFEALVREHGFTHLALENGGLAVERLCAGPLHGTVEDVQAALRHDPMSLAFAAREDLELLVRAAALSPDAVAPVWGLDQETGAAPVVRQLAESLPPGDAQQDLLRLAAEISAVEARRAVERLTGSSLIRSTWLAQPAAPSALDRVESLLDGSSSDAARAGLTALRTSQRLYALFRAGRPYANNAEREGLLVSRFGACLREAAERRGSPPKVLLRLGVEHLSRLENGAHVPSLGSDLVARARRDGVAGLHVAIVGYGPPGSDLAIQRYRPSTARVAVGAMRGTWTLVDTSALREPALRGELGDLDAWLTSLVFGYDAVVLVDAPTAVDQAWWSSSDR